MEIMAAHSAGKTRIDLLDKLEFPRSHSLQYRLSISNKVATLGRRAITGDQYKWNSA